MIRPCLAYLAELKNTSVAGPKRIVGVEDAVFQRDRENIYASATLYNSMQTYVIIIIIFEDHIGMTGRVEKTVTKALVLASCDDTKHDRYYVPNKTNKKQQKFHKRSRSDLFVSGKFQDKKS